MTKLPHETPQEIRPNPLPESLLPSSTEVTDLWYRVQCGKVEARNLLIGRNILERLSGPCEVEDLRRVLIVLTNTVYPDSHKLVRPVSGDYES